jgi:hypothetical protein
MFTFTFLKHLSSLEDFDKIIEEGERKLKEISA